MSTLRRATYHHGDLPSAVLNAAVELLNEQDAETLSVREIARRAGVSAMAPYRHFADRDAVLAAVAIRGFDDLRQTMSAADRSAAPDRALRAQLKAHLSFARQNPGLYRLMFSPFRTRANPDVLKASKATFEVILNRVTPDHPIDRLTSADQALGVWALVHGLATLILDEQLPEALYGGTDQLIGRVLAAMLDRTSPFSP